MEENTNTHLLKLTEAVGTMSGKLDRLCDTTDENFEETFKRLGRLEQNGCAKGEDHTRRISDLETKVTRIMVIGLLVISAVFGTDKVLQWLQGKANAASREHDLVPGSAVTRVVPE